jgi:hypothetical protein
MEDLQKCDKEDDLNDIYTPTLALARKRTTHMRKEQLSQGVLHQIMRSLGRLTFEQVRNDTH